MPIADAVRASWHSAAFFGRRSAARLLDANGFTLFADADDPALATGDHAPDRAHGRCPGCDEGVAT